MNIDLNKANLGQLQYIIRYTEFKPAAMDELQRRIADVTGSNSQAKEVRGRASN